VFLLCVLGANWAWWRSRLRQKALRQEAAEAQLRLLQGQIEPHFLFNTLANVQSLMDVDAPRAKQMLEAFSDYLRAGLTQLRQVDTTLGAELDMAQTYLELMQIRMLDRLNFSIEAGPEARAARLPTLLLQPLVENAIHHGLEPKVEGGRVSIRATLADGRLEVSVVDDGMGLDAPRRSLRGGTGMAVENLRARLQTRYGDAASFTLAPLECGTQATLDLPGAVAA
jgi:sensor histidine kinase YesM